ncbi:hypothetical protein K2173_005479 [Erythroxylum novogranatense]|uniref:Reverse transcriptase domain-containing protein n=1 Tax=Erythroxylum novogranatense TaxID=1862640 RepID=A0AAV8SK43_9ROSI|nr:hypothetical protein K2173_005479 [Erythroxylum novogranatense]
MKFSELYLPSKEESSSANERICQTRANPDVSRDGRRPLFSAKLAKLEFSKYSGEDPTEWFARVSQFFEYQETPDSAKVSLASYHLRGEANEWWQWLRRTHTEAGKDVSWEIFSEELWSRFGPTDCEDFDESLSKIRQTGELRDYQQEFERLGNRTSKDAISLARMKNEQLLRQKKAIRPYFQVSSSSPTQIKPSTPVRRLTWEEMQKCRTQGCSKPQLLLLDGGCNFEEDDADTEPEISLHALTGWSSTGTIRVAIQINSFELIVLIDSGSTHNFINEKIARLLKLPVKPTMPFHVKVANRNPLLCNGKFRNIPFSLHGIPFVATFFSLPLMGLDVVLGVQWLQQLGTVSCNWKTLTMDFHWKGLQRHLQGIQRQQIAPLSFRAMSKELFHRSSVFAICVESSSTILPDGLHPDMQKLLAQFSDIYQKPSQLPPEREIDHHINLKEGADPVNVRPYMYAYFQKEEIKKQVQDMLTSGLIRQSTSPFSSPVLLVKKKDGSWRFYTDYRALNEVTIRDRFPIPTVEDMLDELYGAAYFTKLDFIAGFHQVRVHPADIHKTAFRTHNGHYEYLVMPFGLCNAPSTFQALMNTIFHPYLRKFILVFFDDVLIYSQSWELHLEHTLFILNCSPTVSSLYPNGLFRN